MWERLKYARRDIFARRQFCKKVLKKLIKYKKKLKTIKISYIVYKKKVTDRG